jgi:hypothetical protein
MVKTPLMLFAALVIALGILASLSPAPDRVTDRDIYEATAARRIVPDCTDLHCFRVLVAWTLGALPGSSDLKWKGYAVFCNAAAAVALFQLCLTFGLSRRAAWLASMMSAFGFGSLYTLHDPYTSDPLMYALGPVLTNELVRDRVARAAAIGAIGVLAKEFAAVPFFMFAGYSAFEKRWAAAARCLAAGNFVFLVWLVLQLTLMLRFNYGYGDSTSTHLLSGGAVGPWYAQQSPRGAFSAVFNEYGAVYLLAPVGFLFGPRPLCRLTIAAAPIAVLFAYVQQPDRALWNFHFLALPLAAIVLDRAPSVLRWLTVSAFALANVRVGAQLSIAPAARFALGCSMLLAIASVVMAVRDGRMTATPHPVSA